MILSAIDYGLSITLDEKYINVVVLENPDIFANIVYGLWNPKEDIFTLYDGDKNYKIEKELEALLVIAAAYFCLRALLIQIGVKRFDKLVMGVDCLRALLIQIGVKQFMVSGALFSV